MAALRPKIVKLCKVIGGLTGVMNKIDENAPEYYCMASILTDDEANVKGSSAFLRSLDFLLIFGANHHFFLDFTHKMR